MPQSGFILPPTWEWGEEWQISLDFSSIISSDYGLAEFTDQVFETEVIEPGESNKTVFSSGFCISFSP